MNILIVSQYYYPEQFQINEIAPELVRRGHNVTVLCGLPNYPQGCVYSGYEHRREEMIDGVKVIRCFQIPRGHSSIQLALNYVSFCICALWRIRHLKDKFDIVYSYQLSPITSVLPAVRYSKNRHIPHLLYCLDLWPESILANLHGKKGLIFTMVAKISKYIYNSSDALLVSSRPFIDYLNSENGVDIDKIQYLPQHSSDEMLMMDVKSENNGITDFMFAGNMGEAQSLDVIVKSASIIGKSPDYLIHMVGDGRKRTDIEKMVKEYGLEENFIFYGNQKREDMPSFYRKADALLITLRGINMVGNTVPGKLQAYMTTGKPILGALNGGGKEIIEESKCGLCVNAGDAEGLAANMSHFMENPDDFKQCGEASKIYFRDHFTLKSHVDFLEQELTRLA